MSLSVERFSEYFHALWDLPGRPRGPYPWQERLVRMAHAQGGWPEQLDLPTGSGKTTAMDIALFLMALDADRPATERRFPRRVFMVVDRRTIVDQGIERARTICRKLTHATDGVLAEVADRLCSLFGGDRQRGDRPVESAVLRGAMVRDDSWARRPDQPLLALSTVDQVGSRLLFRGYGVSDGMKPIHAGLLGSDCLYLLDEVHLSVAFDQTLSALSARYLPGDASVQICRLSATPRGGQEAALALNKDDWAHPALSKRLNAPKPATLELVDVKGEEPDKVEAFAAKLHGLARALARPGATVGVIVNRVETARLVAAALVAEAAEVALITGRMRPLDREKVEAHLKPWVDPDRPPSGEGGPRFVVATQCIEAGADYDLDALVTECAPLDALRQRMGRLNRSGARHGASAIIAMRKDQLKGADPVYGAAMANTWVWLSELESIDFKIFNCKSIAKITPEHLLSSSLNAPLLLPAHLNALVQTSPIPEPDPDISLFLHGPQRVSAEVSVVWRADLSQEQMERADLAELEEIVDRLEAVPPGSLEALSLPIGALKRWLNKQDRSFISLSDGGAPAEEKEEGAARRSRDAEQRVLVWRGEDSAWVAVNQLRPGDTVVLPAELGGLSMANFDPGARAPVLDLGDRVQVRLRSRPTLRARALVSLWPDWALRAPIPSGEDDDLDQQVDDWLREAPPRLGDWLGAPIEALLIRRKRRLIVHGGSQGASFTLVGAATGRAGEGAPAESDTSSHTGVRVSLDAHLRGVEFWARRFGAHIGLSASQVEDLASAGRWHDLGKADRRFQLWLHNGNPVAAAMAGAPLAKSATPSQDRAARRRARKKSGYPAGARHELMSLALLEASPQVRAEVEARRGDWDLVCHLVASHHGFARPFAPVAPDERPVMVTWGDVTCSSDHRLERLDGGVSDRFWRLVRRYTPHGLARLEAILRLADHHESALETKPEWKEGA